MRLRWMLALAAAAAVIAVSFGDVSEAQAARRHRMSFTPGSHSRSAVHGYSHGRAAGGRHGSRQGSRHGSRPGGHAPTRRGGGQVDEGGGAAVPGAGFKLENGVLTYPAPARFQPRNLKHP